MADSSPPRLSDDRIRAGYGHIPGLDGLRALSIGIVMVGHFLLGRFAALSTAGVYVFFVISGYLITRLMYAERDRTGGVDIARFYARRFLRLYPVLIVFLIAITAVAWAAGRPRPASEILSVLFYFANYLTSWQEIRGTTFQLPIGVLWSLSVEEHFYLLMPLFFLATRGRHMVAFAIALCVVPLVLRGIEIAIWPWLIAPGCGNPNAFDPTSCSVLYRNSDVRFDGIAYGVLLAAISQTPDPARILRPLGSPWLVAAGIVVMIGSFVMPDGLAKMLLRDTLRSWAAIPVLCSVLFCDSLGWTKRVLEWPPVAWIGMLSYSLYVWHGAQEYFLTAAGIPATTRGFGWMEMAGAFACAIVSYYVFEKPALRFKGRLKPRPPRVAWGDPVPDPVPAAA